MVDRAQKYIELSEAELICRMVEAFAETERPSGLTADQAVGAMPPFERTCWLRVSRGADLLGRMLRQRSDYPVRRHLTIALAGVACLGPLLALAFREQAQPAKAANAFETRYVDLGAAKKQDKLSLEPEIVRTVPIVPVEKPVEKLVTAAVEEPTPEERPAARHRQPVTVESNLCTRHGLRKVITRGGKSWRCQK